MLLPFIMQNLAAATQPQPEPEPAPSPSSSMGPWGGRRARRLPDVALVTQGVVVATLVGTSAVSVTSRPVAVPGVVAAKTDAACARVAAGSSRVRVAPLPDVAAETGRLACTAVPGASSVLVDMPNRHADAHAVLARVTCGESSVKRRWYVSAHRADQAVKPWRLGDA